MTNRGERVIAMRHIHGCGMIEAKREVMRQEIHEQIDNFDGKDPLALRMILRDMMLQLMPRQI